MEPTPNKKMLEPLTKAHNAIEQQNWSLVNQYLGELPLTKGCKSPSRLDEAQINQILDLALQVLLVGDFQERWDVSKLFPRLGSVAIEPLKEILADEEADIELRWFTARILGQFDQPEVLLSLVQLLQTTEDEDLAAIAANSLGNIGDGAIEALSELLAQPQLRLLVVQALSYIRRPNTVVPLLSVVDDLNPEVRAIAIEALSSFRHPQIIPVLLAALTDKVALVRKEAVKALSFRSNQFPGDLVSTLKPLLYDFNLPVCQQTVVTMGRLATKEANKALFELIQSPATPLGLKIESIRALGWSNNLLVLEYFAQGLGYWESALCQEIVIVLGRWQSDEGKVRATQILLDFWQSGRDIVQEKEIKQSLARSWGQLGQHDAIATSLRHFVIATLQQLTTDPDCGVNLHAIAALQHLEQSIT